MKIENLIIQREGSYGVDQTKPLIGKVQIIGEQGKMEIVLSSQSVARIFNMVKSDVERVASLNASQAGHAVDEAQNEYLMLAEPPTDYPE